MRVIAAAAALAVTSCLLVGTMLLVTWAAPPAWLLRWGVRCHPFPAILPAYVMLFIAPALVLIMRRRAAVPRPAPERWVPGMPSGTGM